MKNKTLIYILIGVVILGLLIYFLTKKKKTDLSNKIKDFAQCISDSGAKFYGESFCTYCKKQKEMFGTSVSELPYIECNEKDGSTKQVCKDVHITGYPTWIFADGTRQTGALPLSLLAQKTGCKQ